MKKIFASFGWILLLLPFISIAGTKTLFNTIHSTVSVEERDVSNFNGISSGGSYDVYIKTGTTETLRIEGDADDIEKIETKVENGILKIRNTKTANGWSWNNKERIKIYITAKVLNHLSLSGSGKMDIDGKIKSDKLNVQVSGSGSMEMDIACNTFNAAVSGSGNIRATGSANIAHIAISGSGGFNGRNLKTKTSDIKVSGSGNAQIVVEDQLNAHVSGSGNISYSGNAQVNQRKSGSGRIIRI